MTVMTGSESAFPGVNADSALGRGEMLTLTPHYNAFTHSPTSSGPRYTSPV